MNEKSSARSFFLFLRLHPALFFVLLLSALIPLGGSQVYAEYVTTTVPTGAYPVAIAVNPATNEIFVANSGGDYVTVIDGATNTTWDTGFSYSPVAIAVNPATNRCYVANQGSDTVTVIYYNYFFVSTVPVGTQPNGIAVNPATNEIYVTNYTSDDVTVINGATHKTQSIAVGGWETWGPLAIAVNPVTNKSYVPIWACNRWPSGGFCNVAVIDGATHSAQLLSWDLMPRLVAVNPVTNKTYVSTVMNPTVVAVIEGNNNKTEINTGAHGGAGAVAVNPVTNRIYVASPGDGNVTVIDANTNVVQKVAVGLDPQAIGVNPITNRIYVANQGSKNVTVIDGATNITQTIAVGTEPNAVAVNPITNKIYVANFFGDNVTVIDGATNPTRTISTGASPGHFAVNPVTNMVYATNPTANNVTAIDASSGNTWDIAVNEFPTLIAANPATNKIYVTCADGNVTVIDADTYTTRLVPVGMSPNPLDIAVNPATNKIYVASLGIDVVTEIDGATNSPRTLLEIENPHAIAVNPATNKIYVASIETGHEDNATITEIDGFTENSVGFRAGGHSPKKIAVNPVTNKIYVLNEGYADKLEMGTVTVLDGGAIYQYETIPLEIFPRISPNDIAVNPITNKIYVANGPPTVALKTTVTVIDGATNATETVAVGSVPWAIAINQATNKVYVTNVGDNSTSIIDGATNTVQTVAVGRHPRGVAVNPITNEIYVANSNSNDVTVITEQEKEDIPLTVDITPLPGNKTNHTNPAFNYTATSSYTPTAPPVQRVYYQVDTWTGLWRQAIPSSGSGTFTIPAQLKGVHTLYAFAGDGQEATSINTGKGSSPIPGAMAAYSFVVMEGATAVELTSFTAKGSEDHISLKWETGSELENAGFHLWRSGAGKTNHTRITDTLIPAAGGPAMGASYAYDDFDVAPGKSYCYQLEDIDTSGASKMHGPVTGAVGSIRPVSPEGGASIPRGSIPRFLWESTPYDRFKVQVAASSGFGGKIVTLPAAGGSGKKNWITRLSYKPTAAEWKRVKLLLGKGQTLYWRVSGEDRYGAAITTDAKMFKIKK